MTSEMKDSVTREMKALFTLKVEVPEDQEVDQETTQFEGTFLIGVCGESGIIPEGELNAGQPGVRTSCVLLGNMERTHIAASIHSLLNNLTTDSKGTLDGMLSGLIKYFEDMVREHPTIVIAVRDYLSGLLFDYEESLDLHNDVPMPLVMSDGDMPMPPVMVDFSTGKAYTGPYVEDEEVDEEDVDHE